MIQEAPQQILGIPEIMALNLLEWINGVGVEESYPELYEELGQMPEQFSIKLRDGAKPFALLVP